MGELISEIFTAEGLTALLTLTLLEVVLGIDNVIFISILSGKLEEDEQPRARRLGIAIAVISRIVLLVVLSLVLNTLTEPFITLFGHAFSGRDLILIIGGLFLIGKSTHEIHDKLEGEAEHHETGKVKASLNAVLLQILLIDVVFSLDSVITAIGIAENVLIMMIAILVAAAIMLLAAETISSFVERHPTFKILALAFLILIGAVLVIEGWNPELAHDLHIKNYVYFAMAFSVVVEVINMRLRKPKSKPVHLRNPQLEKAVEKVEKQSN